MSTDLTTITNSMSNWNWASNANATAYKTSMVAIDTVTRHTKSQEYASNAATFASNTCAFASNNINALHGAIDIASMSSVFASNALSRQASHWSWGSNIAARAYYLAASASNVASHANHMSEFAWYRSTWASNVAAHSTDNASSLVAGASNWDWGSNAASYASNICANTHTVLQNQVLLIAKLQQNVLDLEARLKQSDPQVDPQLQKIN